MKFKIRINPMAISDVQEIIAYIAEENPTAAVKIGNAIYSKIEGLADFPEMGVTLSTKLILKWITASLYAAFILYFIGLRENLYRFIVF